MSLVLITTACLFFAVPAIAAGLAFVVGVDTYDRLEPYSQLTNAVNDALAVADVFKTLDYHVTAGHDLTRSDFNRAWQSLVDQVRDGDTTAIFLSAHGVEIGGQNFILPRDIPYIIPGRQEQLRSESISVSQMLLDLRNRHPNLILLILDACRANPMIMPEWKTSKANAGGLSAMNVASGEFFMYSAGVEETSLDRLPGDDRVKHSVFVRHLLPMMMQPNLTIVELAREVRRQVHELAISVGLYQYPAYYDGLLGDFCLNGCSGAAIAEKEEQAEKLQESEPPVLTAGSGNWRSKPVEDWLRE